MSHAGPAIVYHPLERLSAAASQRVRDDCLQIALTEDEQAVVNIERNTHPETHVRRKMLVLWWLHCGVPRAKVAGLGRATVQRYVAAYWEGGSDALRPWDVVGPVSDLTTYTETIRESLTASPVRTISEACDRIATLTGGRCQPTQVRVFLAGLGFRWWGAGPFPQKKISLTTSATKRSFSMRN